MRRTDFLFMFRHSMCLLSTRGASFMIIELGIFLYEIILKVQGWMTFKLLVEPIFRGSRLATGL